ncbi:CRISPR-associated endonuclease Cas1 [Amaricoccus sp.]|uniref:CRISPR-associated endonuclease Cas1 n=1 Tax=Amaricoccus sp. TaxID=1872485 RepID=UPI001B5D422B|nr:CRISPR-associated endonuclease Cas1 [Amaricoccus sp.]MBP7003414.1 CRISPR-associated endonuclease Cas1 [Amaricoccus sp.]
MRKLLNTVYVTTEGAALRKDGENLVAEVEGETKARVPLHMLASVVAFGPILVSPALIGACAAAGITLVLLDRNGRFQARIEGPVSGNVLLRRAQYRVSEAPEEIVRSLLIGKVANQRAVLLRALRDHGPEMEPPARADLEAAAERVAHVLRRITYADAGLEALRGSEGEAANLYFSVFDRLIRSPDPELRFHGRSRRPPLDAINALLSFLYTLLTHVNRRANSTPDRRPILTPLSS